VDRHRAGRFPDGAHLVLEHVGHLDRQVHRDPVDQQLHPNCALGKTSYHKLHVTLNWIKWHGSTRYFYRMTWYTPGYRLRGYSTSTAVLHFGLQGGTAPGWH
jgi:hypothetical protein